MAPPVRAGPAFEQTHRGMGVLARIGSTSLENAKRSTVDISGRVLRLLLLLRDLTTLPCMPAAGLTEIFPVTGLVAERLYLRAEAGRPCTVLARDLV